MKNSASVNNLYKDHPFCYNRLDTDTLFALPSGSISLNGKLDYAIRFIEDYQLMSPALWAKFVTQFRDTDPKADDGNFGWRGEYWGKMMRGACFTYAYTKNEKLYEILEETVKDMMTTQDSLGRISSYSVEKQYNGWDIWARKYVLLGMQYFIEICKDKTLIAEITECMKKQADYLISTIGREEDGKILITKTSDFWLGMNSSSLLEPIVRLYNITKEKKYLDFAEYIIDCGVICTPEVSIFELAYEDKLDPHQYPTVKAYEMMSCFEGLIEYYRITKNEKWKTAIINFANRVIKTEISVIGCSGCRHELFDNTVVRQTNTEYGGVIQETCVTVTWMKFCYQLLCLTGNPIYADQIEKSVYNALLGAINFGKNKANGDLPFDSYSPLLYSTRFRGIGGKQIMADGSFYGCCACIGSAGTGLIGMSAVMLSDNGFTVNLYANSEFTVPTPDGSNIKVKIETNYPADGCIKLTFLDDCTKALNVSLRIPEWSVNTSAYVCGESASVNAGKYASFDRVWKCGDTVTLELDMRCILSKATPDKNDKNSQYHVSLRRGPIALARDIRLPGDFESIVNFAPDENGAVPCTPSDKCDFEHDLCFAVKEANGNEIIMVDYASAGLTWDEDSMTTVWMATKNYWSIDISKSFKIVSLDVWEVNKKPFAFTANENGELVSSVDIHDAFTAEALSNGLYKLRHQSGKYLDVTEDAVAKLSENGTELKVIKYALNRFHIHTKDGLAMVGVDRYIEDMRAKFAPASYQAAQTLKLVQI